MVAFELYIGGALLVIGAVFALLSTVGVIRLPDVYTRMHAASKAGAVGGGLILLAVALVGQDSAVTLRALIGIVFLLLTTPLSAHLLAKAALFSGIIPIGTDESVKDDLRKGQNSAI